MFAASSNDVPVPVEYVVPASRLYSQLATSAASVTFTVASLVVLVTVPVSAFNANEAAALVVSNVAVSVAPVAVLPTVSVTANEAVILPSVKPVRSIVAVPLADTLAVFVLLEASVKVTTPVASASRPDTVYSNVPLAALLIVVRVIATAASALTSASVSVIVESVEEDPPPPPAAAPPKANRPMYP